MRRKRLFLFGAVALAAVGAIGFAVLSQSAPGEASAATDPREAPVLVKVARAAGVHGAERSFTGTVAARGQSNLGFRVPGKIVEIDALPQLYPICGGRGRVHHVSLLQTARA